MSAVALKRNQETRFRRIDLGILWCVVRPHAAAHSKDRHRPDRDQRRPLTRRLSRFARQPPGCRDCDEDNRDVARAFVYLEQSQLPKRIVASIQLMDGELRRDVRLNRVQPEPLHRDRAHYYCNKHHQSLNSAHFSRLSKLADFSALASALLREVRPSVRLGKVCETILALGVSLKELAVGLEPPSVPDAATSCAPILSREFWVPRWPALAAPFSTNKELCYVRQEPATQRSAVALVIVDVADSRGVT